MWRSEERSPCEVEPKLVSIWFEPPKEPKRLTVTLETAEVAHHVVKRDLTPTVSKWWLSQIVRKGDGLHQRQWRQTLDDLPILVILRS